MPTVSASVASNMLAASTSVAGNTTTEDFLVGGVPAEGFYKQPSRRYLCNLDLEEKLALQLRQ